MYFPCCVCQNRECDENKILNINQSLREKLTFKLIERNNFFFGSKRKIEKIVKNLPCFDRIKSKSIRCNI